MWIIFANVSFEIPVIRPFIWIYIRPITIFSLCKGSSIIPLTILHFTCTKPFKFINSTCVSIELEVNSVRICCYYITWLFRGMCKFAFAYIYAEHEVREWWQIDCWFAWYVNQVIKKKESIFIWHITLPL